ncbi:GNAT family N-acetyltransferase [Cohnella abietis]|uniref:N-acetyltransferase domain-containing protein n=1 Tax=Cohnella abietis TaxID=2507935 RepID=A0A3T1D1Y2_9BACL|nr:GNAT family N-acetyltransferase [Cohnella abietis]BBI32110.1 hypothetical protein KCTCHS21_15090 [Cohnella abietis]
MLKLPTTIRALRFILFFKIALFIMVMIAFFRNSAEPLSTSSAINISISFLAMLLLLFSISKKKHFPSIIISLVVFWFSIDMIQIMLSLVIVLLFFFKSTRSYFRSANAISAPSTDEDEAQLAEEAVDEDASGEAQPKLDVNKAQAKSRKDPEVYIREATPEDADTIYSLMHIAFEEYRTAIPPSSALEETDESVLSALRDQGESAAILYEDDTATAMVRFKYDRDEIYFFRLSVVPARRRRGYAKQLVKWIEKQGITKGLNVSRCKVRQSIQNNLVLYQDMGYEVVNQELIVRPGGTIKELTLEKRIGL